MAEADWRKWYEMALASQRAARMLISVDPRSCVSRCYYAAYQAVTAVLLYRGGVPPADREAWNHEITPELLVENWAPLVRSRDARQSLAARLRSLYALRVRADYIGGNALEASAASLALRDSGLLINVAARSLPGD